ncbi:MAG TPA: OsmC family protein, partial [Thermoplasmata archaeon]|nr:OsmC family protein [Thermoplasmata archaeon]
MSDDESEVEVRLSRIEDYSFKIDFGLNGVAPLIGDEDPPLGKNAGPDPSRLLGAAIAQCTLSSLLFCMQRSRADVTELKAIAKLRFGRNEKKRIRITGIELRIEANASESDRSKLERCLPIFQDF